MELPAGEKRQTKETSLIEANFVVMVIRSYASWGRIALSRELGLAGREVDNISAALGSNRATHAAYWPTMARAAKNSTPRHRSRVGTLTITNASIDLALAASGHSIRALQTHCPETKEAI